MSKLSGFPYLRPCADSQASELEDKLGFAFMSVAAMDVSPSESAIPQLPITYACNK